MTTMLKAEEVLKTVVSISARMIDLVNLSEVFGR